jgi:hypothetical protein
MILSGSRAFNGKFGPDMSGISWIATPGLAMTGPVGFFTTDRNQNSYGSGKKPCNPCRPDCSVAENALVFKDTRKIVIIRTKGKIVRRFLLFDFFMCSPQFSSWGCLVSGLYFAAQMPSYHLKRLSVCASDSFHS